MPFTLLMRDLPSVIGSGGGSLLLPALRTTRNMMKRTSAFYVGGQDIGGPTPATASVAVGNTQKDTLTFLTKGHMLVRSPPQHTRTRQKLISLHKKEAHSDSEVKCCFASPVSERTALACCNKLSSRNLPSLRNQTSLSSKLRSSVPSISQPLSWNIPSAFGLSTPSGRLWIVAKPNAKYINKSLSSNIFQFRTFFSSSVSANSAIMSNGNGSLARQNFHEDCEANINKQINMELYASYVYMSMAYYFDREDVALPGFSKWFKKASDEEREHAEKFMKYQNQRGGRIVLQPIAKPTQDEWSSALEATQAALDLEKTVNQTLLELHVCAGARNDPQLCDFLESNFLEEQVHAIKELSEMVTKLKRVGTGLGEYLFDKDLGCSE